MKSAGLLLVLAALTVSALFAGCVKEQENEEDICKTPYARIEGACCLDVNGNGVCDRKDASKTSPSAPATQATLPDSTIKTSSTSITRLATTSSTSPAPATLKECASAGECGKAYYGSCGCRGGNVTRTRYTPICSRGACKYKSETEVVKCRRSLDAEGEETMSSERCVSGYVSCMTRRDHDKYFEVPDDAVVLVNLTGDGFVEEYRKHRFRTDRVEYPEEMRCFDDMVFYVDVMKPDGTINQVSYAWNRTAEYDGLEIGLARVNLLINGSVNPIAWVRRT